MTDRACKKNYSIFIGDEVHQVLEVSVYGSHEMPVANSDFATALQGKPTIISVLDNDQGNSMISVASVTKPDHGTAIINADNTITYTSERSFIGNDSFGYTINDVNGNTATADVYVTVLEWVEPAIVR